MLMLASTVCGGVASAMTRQSAGVSSRVSDGLPWPGDRGKWASSVKRIAACSDVELKARFQREQSESRVYLRPYDADLAGCVALWESEKDSVAKKQALRMLGVCLSPFDQLDTDDLAGRITEQGSIDSANIRARDATYHFALRYRLDGNTHDARRAAALLKGFASVVPKWPVWCPYYAADSEKRALPPVAETFQDDYAAGIWGNWIYQDLVEAVPLLQAYVWILSSGMLGGEDRAKCLELFELFLSFQRMRGGAEFTNMDAFKIRGLISFGLLLKDPTLVHEGVWHLRSIYQVGFFPDGWWHEGSPAYHTDLLRGLRTAATDLLRDYSDPPTFHGSRWRNRIDRLDPESEFGERPLAADSVADDMTLPDGRLLAIHDTDWNMSSDRKPRSQVRSVLHGCFGQARLATGVPGGETAAILHWSGSGVHAHWDALNLHLWSKGREVISETSYKPIDASGSTREWHTSTAGHVTVVVDQTSQSNSGSRGRAYRARSELDDIPGVPDWPWRFRGENANDFGELRLCNFDFERVQVVEASAVQSYSSVLPVTQYMRTLALCQIDDRDSYLLDIFRVRGGTIHDYMLHGPLQQSYEVEVSLPLELREGNVHGYLKDLRRGRTDAAWLAAFDLGEQLRLLSLFCQAPNTEVILAHGPAMRRKGTAPFIVVRRTQGESTFVVLHQVTLAGPPRVRAIDLLSTDEEAVVVRIDLGSRVDTVVSCVTRKNEITLGNEGKVRARFAHLAESTADDQRWGYMIDGDTLQSADWSIDGDSAQEGVVVGTMRRDQGDSVNAILTDRPVQLGASVQGQTVIVRLGDLALWGYEICSSDVHGQGSLVQCRHDPGFSVAGVTVKQLGFPSWGVRGSATYRIPGSALVRFDPDGTPKLRATGSAKLSSVSRVPARPN